MKGVRKNRSFLLALVVLTCAPAPCVRAQVVTVEPQKPRLGDTLAVTYDPRAEGAALKAGEDIYVIVGTYCTFGIEAFTAKMSKEGEVFKYKFPIVQSFSAVQFNFITLKEWQEKNYYNTLIYRPDGEPVRGGYQSRIRSKGYLEMAAKELALYPDNYATYLEKWQWAGIQDRDKQLSIVKEDMARLPVATKDGPADLLCALSYGYLLLPKGRGEKP